MKVFEFIKGLKYKGKVNNLNEEISNLTTSSKEVEKGSVFFAVKGEKADGNDYILEAINKGAILVITQNDCCLDNVITVNDVRKEISKLSYKFYEPNKKRVKVIGVVGTNGKTSTTYLIKNILSKVGKKVGIIGTLGIFYNKHKIEPSLTTPDAIYLNKTFMDMANENIEYVVMELSAHAISQKRAYSTVFDVLVFTNCTHDHLDYFKTFDEYKKTKLSVFNNLSARLAVVNADDDSGKEIILSNKLSVISYGLNNPSDVFAVQVKLSSTKTTFVVNAFDDIDFVTTKLLGEFNVYNALSAITVCLALGVNLKTAVNAICDTEQISGRLEYVENYNGADIYVDYAHTPDGLKNLLTSLRQICKNKLYLIFGCGGNRDKEKRSLMGKIAGEYADFSIITSDNPRFEEPYSIIKEIETGIRDKTSKYITIQNRYVAIGYGLTHLSQGDVLVIAGKGAENYQDVMGIKLHFNDKETVRDIISKLYLGGEFF